MSDELTDYAVCKLEVETLLLPPNLFLPNEEGHLERNHSMKEMDVNGKMIHQPYDRDDRLEYYEWTFHWYHIRYEETICHV